MHHPKQCINKNINNFSVIFIFQDFTDCQKIAKTIPRNKKLFIIFPKIFISKKFILFQLLTIKNVH